MIGACPATTDYSLAMLEFENKDVENIYAFVEKVIAPRVFFVMFWVTFCFLCFVCGTAVLRCCGFAIDWWVLGLVFCAGVIFKVHCWACVVSSCSGVLWCVWWNVEF